MNELITLSLSVTFPRSATPAHARTPVNDLDDDIPF
jgi:hypothetical protein